VWCVRVCAWVYVCVVCACVVCVCCVRACDVCVSVYACVFDYVYVFVSVCTCVCVRMGCGLEGQERVGQLETELTVAKAAHSAELQTRTLELESKVRLRGPCWRYAPRARHSNARPAPPLQCRRVFGVRAWGDFPRETQQRWEMEVHSWEVTLDLLVVGCGDATFQTPPPPSTH
jgi:hypothetical protein